MRNDNVILADQNTIFTLDVGDELRSNGFKDDFLTVLSTEEQLMKELPRKRPGVLILGDLNTDFAGHENGSPFTSSQTESFVDEVLTSYPDTEVVRVGTRDKCSSMKPITYFQKPVKPSDILGAVENLVETKGTTG